MELFSSATPAYKGTNSQPQASTGILPTLGLFGGSGAPSYKTLSGNGAQAPATSQGWWQVFSSGTPSYKTAPPVATDTGDPSTSSIVDDGTDPDCGGVDDQTPQVVIL